MKGPADNGWDENLIVSEQSLKAKRNRLSDHELEELREHIDLISFNIGKVYQHAKDRSRKELKKVKHNFRKKLHHLE
ncbi:MAG: hypothetical protein WC635_01705 [Bacteriovorax sp.]